MHQQATARFFVNGKWVYACPDHYEEVWDRAEAEDGTRRVEEAPPGISCQAIEFLVQ